MSRLKFRRLDKIRNALNGINQKFTNCDNLDDALEISELDSAIDRILVDEKFLTKFQSLKNLNVKSKKLRRF